MTSALRGREGVVQNMTIVLICCVNGTVTRGEGSKNPKNLWTSFKFKYGPFSKDNVNEPQSLNAAGTALEINAQNENQV